MGKLEVKKIIRRCVSRWADTEARQTDVLSVLKNVTAASKRSLAREINDHADLKACKPVIAEDQIRGAMKVTELGERVWDNEPECLAALP
ncbi:MAG: hypothetical protein AAF604_23020 [Acidobacteriota bacterium]